jgi:hypothetical protein
VNTLQAGMVALFGPPAHYEFVICLQGQRSGWLSKLHAKAATNPPSPTKATPRFPMTDPKRPMTFAAMLVRAQRRFEAVGRSNAPAGGAGSAAFRPAFHHGAAAAASAMK